MKYPTYSVKKNSGIDWLSDIPSHWEVKRLGFLLERIDGGVWGNNSDSENDTIVLRSTEQNIDGTWKLEDPARRKLTEKEKLSALLDEGDLVVTKSSGSAQHIGKTSYVTREIASMNCCFSNFMQRLRPKTKNHSRFLFFVLNNPIAREQFNYFSNSTTGLANLNASVIGQVRVAVPPEDEIEHLLHFLDIETAQIDTLIAKQEQLISLLQEKRQSLINRTVTKGVNPHVPLRNSGVEWIGEIPSHWQISRSKWLFRHRKERARTNDIQLSATQAYGVISQAEYMDRESRKVTQITQHLDKRAHVEVDDFVISMRSFQGGLERAWQSGCIRSSYVVLEPSPQASPDFFTYLFKSQSYIHALRATSNFIRDGQDLNINNFHLVDLPIIPIKEQSSIAAFLDVETSHIDTLTEKAKAAIAVLQERRASLISAVVTGKIDVRAYTNGTPL